MDRIEKLQNILKILEDDFQVRIIYYSKEIIRQKVKLIYIKNDK